MLSWEWWFGLGLHVTLAERIFGLVVWGAAGLGGRIVWRAEMEVRFGDGWEGSLMEMRV